MRIFILGGRPDDCTEQDKDVLDDYCRRLGAAVRAAGHSVIVCSVYEGSADLPFLQGMAGAAVEGEPDVTICFPDDDQVESEVRAFSRTLPFTLLMSPVRTPVLTSATRPYAYLLCQLLAVDRSDVVIAVGGRSDGPVPMLLRLAESKQKAIVPVTALRGAAQSYYQSKREQYRHQSDVLSSLDRVEDVVALLGPGAMRPGSLSDTIFFISYCRRNAKQADIVENVLRRRGAALFRDEEGIAAGEDWSRRLEGELARATIFVALWSTEYACSPRCFEEMEAALGRDPSVRIWLTRLDETEVTFPRARELNHLAGTTRARLVASLEAEIRKYDEELRSHQMRSAVG